MTEKEIPELFIIGTNECFDEIRRRETLIEYSFMTSFQAISRANREVKPIKIYDMGT